MGKEILKEMEIFMDNSSTQEALSDFVQYRVRSLKSLTKHCWPPECKQFIEQKLIPIGEKESRKLIREFLKENGIYG